MSPLVRILCVLCLCSLPTAAQRLTHVEILDPAARRLGLALEEEGWDVVEGSVEAKRLELVVTPMGLAELVARGLEPHQLAVGRPLAEIQAERTAAYLAAHPEGIPPAGYPDLAAVLAEMQAAAAAHPTICQYVDLTVRYGLPRTEEGRHLYALKISDQVTLEEDEPTMLVLTNAHARETVTPLISLEAIERLTDDYATDAAIRAVVDANEIWILPTANPDGYDYVFTGDNFWRKNRHDFGASGIGVDINRNFRFGWDSFCGGSTLISSQTYRGPSPGSEVETQVVEALSYDRRFAKVLDFHSYGRETLWEYGCSDYPTASYLMAGAIALSTSAGYFGAERPPTANGEHFEWQLAAFGSYAFLMETALTFQPLFADAELEAQQVWPAIRDTLALPIPISGHVADACDGSPVAAEITFAGLPFLNGESVASGGAFGRYHAFLPAGIQTLTFSAPGYAPQTIPVNVVAGGGATLDVALVAVASATVRNGSGANTACYTPLAPPVLGGNWVSEVDHSGHPGATLTAIVLYAAPSAGTFLPGGEVLVDLGSPKLSTLLGPATGTLDTFSQAVPNDCAFAGLTLATQAVVLGGAGYELCNAVDLVVGG